jgi:rhodanese-related sulfurtransferase
MYKLLSLVLFLFSPFLHAQVKNVDAREFNSLTAQKDAVIIDLRTDDEIRRKGRIAHSVQIDYLAKDSEEKILKLERSGNYLLYCAGGGRSSECAELMLKNGFSRIVNLENGFDDWKKKGHPIVKE